MHLCQPICNAWASCHGWLPPEVLKILLIGWPAGLRPQFRPCPMCDTCMGLTQKVGIRPATRVTGHMANIYIYIYIYTSCNARVASHGTLMENMPKPPGRNRNHPRARQGCVHSCCWPPVLHTFRPIPAMRWGRLSRGPHQS